MVEGLIARLGVASVHALLPISRCEKISRSAFVTLSVTRVDIFAITEASTGIKFSSELIIKLLNIRNLIWVIFYFQFSIT